MVLELGRLLELERTAALAVRGMARALLGEPEPAWQFLALLAWRLGTGELYVDGDRVCGRETRHCVNAYELLEELDDWIHWRTEARRQLRAVIEECAGKPTTYCRAALEEVARVVEDMMAEGVNPRRALADIRRYGKARRPDVPELLEKLGRWARARSTLRRCARAAFLRRTREARPRPR